MTIKINADFSDRIKGATIWNAAYITAKTYDEYYMTRKPNKRMKLTAVSDISFWVHHTRTGVIVLKHIE